jgi:uncharacterized repeat protein (TIGR01451 family)
MGFNSRPGALWVVVTVLVVAMLPVRVAALSPSTTTLVSSPNPSTFGQAVTLTATVSPAAASGKVTFYDGVTVLGTGTLSGGKAALVTGLSSGNRLLRAYYAGDGNFAAGTSETVSQEVVVLPQNGFLPAVSIAAGNGPNAVAVGDFNGDGKADLALVNVNGGNGGSVSVLLGNGDGTFQAAVTYSAGASSESLAVGDFNGDSKADLAVVSGFGVSILLGNGDGTFQAAVTYTSGSLGQGGGGTSVAVGDFNGDGKADLVVSNSNNNNLAVLLGNGDGTFQTPVNYAVSTPISVAVGDFNGDGKADVAVANYLADTVSVLLGNGDGTFQAAVSSNSGNLPQFVAVGDFNGDGKPDLAAANLNSGTVSVLLGKGDGTFQPAISNTVGTAPVCITVGDLNGDGKADLAVANFSSNNVSVLIGKGDGTFQPIVNYTAGTSPRSIVVEDFKGDGVSDLAIANSTSNNVSILFGVPTNPDLTIKSAHTGSFAQGQAGASYSLTVTNDGAVPSAGAVTVTDALPVGLTATAMGGAGWACTLETLACTRSDALGAFASYPAITLMVNVSSTAAANVINTASVSGGGELSTTNGTTSDPTTVIQAADLTIVKTHSGSFTQGQGVATYTILVSNTGAGPTTGTVTAIDTLPAGLTATAIVGADWTCTLGNLTCTRSDVLAAGASYPVITLTVSVSITAAASLTNTATVSGGGELNTANDTAADPTAVKAGPVINAGGVVTGANYAAQHPA